MIVKEEEHIALENSESEEITRNVNNKIAYLNDVFYYSDVEEAYALFNDFDEVVKAMMTNFYLEKGYIEQYDHKEQVNKDLTKLIWYYDNYFIVSIGYLGLSFGALIGLSILIVYSGGTTSGDFSTLISAASLVYLVLYLLYLKEIYRARERILSFGIDGGEYLVNEKRKLYAMDIDKFRKDEEIQLKIIPNWLYESFKDSPFFYLFFGILLVFIVKGVIDGISNMFSSKDDN